MLCKNLKFAIIGAGGVGQVIVNRLVKVEGAKVKVGDLDQTRLRDVKRSAGEVSALKLDAGSAAKVEHFIKRSDLVVNASDPRFNQLIMKQAIKRKVNYIDLAGENPLSVGQQFKQDRLWRRAGLVAILGMGEDPGFSNILARRGCDMLDSVKEVRVRDGETSSTDAYPFVALFAPGVFLEEAVSPCHYFEGGELKTSPAMSRKETYHFPHPIGEIPVYGMDHEEVHTLPYYLPKKPNYVDFKLALTDDTAAAIKLFHGVGLLNAKPLKFGKAEVSPLKVLLHLLPTPSQVAGKIHGSAGISVEVRGEKSGEQQTIKHHVIMTHDEAYEKHRANATSYLTGTPTAICARMVAEGRIENRGVTVPECLNAESFLAEAPAYDLRVHLEVMIRDA